MREIKFRLRIGKKNVGYEKWYRGSYGEIMTANACWLYSKDGEAWLPSYIFHKEKCQFTGLKDKNGKEIYEGDIVRRLDTESIVYYLSDGDKIIEVMRDVVTMERFPGYWLENEGWGYEGECLEEPKCCEVIGNKYQNPELLPIDDTHNPIY